MVTAMTAGNVVAFNLDWNGLFFFKQDKNRFKTSITV